VPDGDVHPATQRVLDAAARKGVALEIHVFPEGTHTASDAAAAVGAELGQIVKSLVFVAPAEDGTLDPIVCLVSGPNRVDVARLAAVTGEPGIRRATAREANDLTGFVIGGIPPIGHARPVRIVMDPDLGRFRTVWAAAGTATAVFPVSPGALRSLANATVAPIAEEPIEAPSAPPAPEAERPADAAAGEAVVNGPGFGGDPAAQGAGV
jgi:prolyl-tRNA editing enzyme YbaK/EbsC (Cys-tRNA(Pro) deacylase)